MNRKALSFKQKFKETTRKVHHGFAFTEEQKIRCLDLRDRNNLSCQFISQEKGDILAQLIFELTFWMQAPLWGFFNPKNLEELEKEARKCKRCQLHQERTSVVFGDGPPSKIVFVGEAPGYWEDQQGKPFVGAAGKFLNSLLEMAGLKREQVYICNTVKCRPPGNRDPLPEEIEACKPFLVGQLSFLKPTLVVALGRISAGELLGREVGMTAEHGKLVDCTFAGLRFKLFLTFHPAAGLYSGSIKKLLISDFERLREIVRELG